MPPQNSNPLPPQAPLNQRPPPPQNPIPLNQVPNVQNRPVHLEEYGREDYEGYGTFDDAYMRGGRDERGSCGSKEISRVKDQTYFLSHLSQAQLKRLIFPLGCIQKDEVRMLAKSFNLPNQDRKDSQGICFLGKIKFSEFVARHIGESEGVILEAESGDYLGNHRGFWFYTIGQRQGLRLPGGPWYVVEKDIRNNVVYVSRNYFSVDKKRRLFRVGSLKWLSGLLPRQISELQCKVRHGPGFYNCSLVVEVDEHGREVAVVRLSEDDQGLAAGQFAAFYDRRICIGSGIILESWDDQGYPICARALEIARMEDKSKLGKPVKIMVKPEPIVSTI
ncbi:putative GTPase Der-like [Capsicum annuum]|nr:putative GTPase Der-like [Capsicum annuum]